MAGNFVVCTRIIYRYDSAYNKFLLDIYNIRTVSIEEVDMVIGTTGRMHNILDTHPVCVFS
jgi:hypothetical protein